MTFDIVIQRRGERLPAAVVKVCRSVCEALSFVSDLNNLPHDTIHYCIISETGVYVWDTRKDDLLPA